ncbi:MAG: PH domain-containing protein [Lachnospiraceae bacterium]
MAKKEDKIIYKEKKRVLFLGLPFTFTTYTLTEEMLTVDEGFFDTEENDCYLYKVQDVKLQRSLLERLFGLGTIICYTGDNTDATIYLTHIRHAKEIKNYILDASEKERVKKRTLNTQNIGMQLEEE